MWRIGFRVAAIVVPSLLFIQMAVADDAPAGAGTAPEKLVPKSIAGPKPNKGKTDVLPTMEEIQRSFDEGAYEVTVKLIARAASAKGDAAEQFDRYKLLILKGEAYLKMKAPLPAVDAFNDAANATKDKKKRAVNRSTALLIKKVKGVTYGPAPGKEKGEGVIDLSDVDKRPEALNRFWNEESSRVVAIQKAASDLRELPPIFAAVEELQSLQDIEVAATGAHARLDEAAEAVGGRALKLMDRELNRFEKRSDELMKSAGLVSRMGTGIYRRGVEEATVTVSRRRGLAPKEVAELRGFLRDASAIAKAAKTFGELTDRPEMVDALIEKAKSIADDVEVALRD